MENLTIRTTNLRTGLYALGLDFRNRQVNMDTHSYTHCPGNNVDIAIFDLTPEDILQIADSIRKVALDLKPELNESLMVGAGI